jgi:hypothetical protein
VDSRREKLLHALDGVLPWNTLCAVFNGWGMGDERVVEGEEGVGDNDIERPPAARAKLNINELQFLKSQIRVEMLAYILGGVNVLERFDYEGAGAAFGECDFNIKRLLQALVETAGHSLDALRIEHVDLANEARIPSPMLSCCFERLCTLSEALPTGDVAYWRRCR